MQEEGVIGMGVFSRFKFAVPIVEGMEFKLCLINGQITIYASTIPNPSSAQYTWREVVTASAQPPSCSTMFYELSMLRGNEKCRGYQFNSTDIISLYITLEGQADINEFTFNTSVRNITLGKVHNGIIYIHESRSDITD